MSQLTLALNDPADMLQVQVCQTTPNVKHNILNSTCNYYFDTITTSSRNNQLNDEFVKIIRWATHILVLRMQTSLDKTILLLTQRTP